MACRQLVTKLKPFINCSLSRNSQQFSLQRGLACESTPSTKNLCRPCTAPCTISLQPTTHAPTKVCRPTVPPCPPQPCACPPSQDLKKRLVGPLWYLARLALFLAVVKFTIDEGLWGTAEETENLARRMGLVSDPDDEDQEKKEKKEGVTEKKSLAAMWNSLVINVGKVFGLDP